ncbi:hypothetical protein E4U57_005093 [Claviceps arundinis]|uniref:Uncharacterized protein n=1 Tax=Claviceps arundinis TaxID=1623583 RepID=A0ABQ7P3U1_9HYPO|nr:hypothetical protein E4U57_005093 [Claviceps arundinis]
MVKILSIFLATLAAISPVAQAGNCVPGLKYCGSTLQRYVLTAIDALPIVDFPGAEKLERNVLYDCISPREVRDLWECRWCHDGGGGRAMVRSSAGPSFLSGGSVATCMWFLVLFTTSLSAVAGAGADVWADDDLGAEPA